MKILANCEGIQVERTLGVARFTFNTFAALRKYFDIQIACQVSPSMVAAYLALPEVCDFVYSKNIFNPSWLGGSSLLIRTLRKGYRLTYERIIQNKAKSLRNCNLEFVPHHFQHPIGALPKVVVCYDLHIFDVPWKYHPRGQFLEQFTSNLTSASAILVPFIRPFRNLSSLIDGIQDRIFLIECPTLLADVPLGNGILANVRTRFFPDNKHQLLLYPAQLQEHKNHKNLISALAILQNAGKHIHLVCPGSDFSEKITKSIVRHAEILEMVDHLSFPGLVTPEELRALYEVCTVVISPSLAEGGNMIVQEAITFGKPVACADTEPSRDHIAFMGAKVPLFNGNDPASIAESIWDIICKGPTYVVANQQARKHIASWTWYHVAERCVDVFKWVAEGCRANEKPRQQLG